jgi:serine phosphatase RsbU (regulator of sigma subunit)/CBS domain-containing protein
MHSEPSTSETNLRSLVDHDVWIDADAPLEEANRLFTKDDNLQSMPVVEGGRVIGLCARRQVGVVLGARYGFSLFSRKPVRNFMLPEMILIREDEPLADVLQRVFSRGPETFDDDVVLVTAAGALIGTIFVRTLVRLQHAMLLSNIAQLEERRREIERRNAEMESDLIMAADVQRAMLPQQYPSFPEHELPEFSTLRFAHRYLPSSLVSGDFFYVMRLADGSAGIFICDVMGHGVRSALIVAMLRALVEELRPHALDPGLLLARMNQEMRTILRQHDEPMFASAIYMVMDAEQGVVRCAVAGHPLPLHVRRETGEVAVLPLPRRDCGPVLGLFDNAIYPVSDARVAPGDVLVLFTDGVYEASSADEEYGIERLLRAVSDHQELAADRLLDGALEDVRAFLRNEPFSDDVCLLAVEVATAESRLAGRSVAVAGVEEECAGTGGAAAS